MRPFDTFGIPALLVAAISALAGPVAAQCPAADTFEDNDDCLTAVPLTNGTYTGLTVQGAFDVNGVDDDFYAVTLPVGEILTVDCLFVDAVADVDVYFYDSTAPNCGGEAAGDYLVRGFTASDNEHVVYTNPTAAPMTIIVRVEMFTTTVACNDYDLVVSTAPDPCATPADDTFEENDACGTAAALASGATTGLFVSETDWDYYTISVPAGEILTVDMTYGGGSADVDMRLYDDLACANQVDSIFPAGGSGQVEGLNATGATTTFVLAVEVVAGDGCNTYDLNVTTAPDPCLNPASDDSFEDNDDCASAVSMADGTFPSLFVVKGDDDFYEVSVADGDTLFVDLAFTHATADVDVYIYDDPIACGDLTSYLARGYSASDNENISWTNTSGSTQTYFVQVVVYAFAAGDCNDYDMTLTGTGGSLTTPFCFGDGTADAGSGPVACPCGNESTVGAGEGCKSSLGVGAILTTSGSTVVANDDLSFTLSQARANQPSLLVQGTNLIAVPFKDGILCMGNPTERIEVVFLDATGSGTTTASIVTEGNVSPGDTRYYQQWFRDPGGVSPCGSGSNFSQGLIVLWN